MLDELITTDNLSKALLKEVLEEVLIRVSLDEDGDLLVREGGVACYVMIEEESRERVMFFSSFHFAEASSPLQRLECVNRVNTEYVMVRAVARDNDQLLFSYTLYVDGGITQRAFVLALRRFCELPRLAVQECCAEVMS